MIPPDRPRVTETKTWRHVTVGRVNNKLTSTGLHLPSTGKRNKLTLAEKCDGFGIWFDLTFLLGAGLHTIWHFFVLFCFTSAASHFLHFLVCEKRHHEKSRYLLSVSIFSFSHNQKPYQSNANCTLFHENKLQSSHQILLFHSYTR